MKYTCKGTHKICINFVVGFRSERVQNDQLRIYYINTYILSIFIYAHNFATLILFDTVGANHIF